MHTLARRSLQFISLGLLLIAIGTLPGCQRSGTTPTAQGQSAVLVDGPTNDAVGAEGGITREQTLMASLTIFVLAVFVGFEVIAKVPPTLHTPLMSGSNAISGITVVGAVLMAATNDNAWTMVLGAIAVVMATINVVGGFIVTDRMLKMFKRK